MKKIKKSVVGDESLQNSEHKDFLTVGIGASAGGIGALKQFFGAMPDAPDMAFVVILHLSDEHESSLAQIIQTNTSMKVEQVTKTVKVEPNKVYVIPPAKGLEMVDGHIKLTEPEHIKGKRVPIDLFFRSLADAYGKNGIAVVLSGTGSDGTLGLKRVKENGGITVAQEPSEAEYDGMPQSAVNTGLVDLILPVAEIPERLIELRDTGKKIRLPKEKDEIPAAKDKDANALHEILAIVRVRTGHDFSNYKPATVLRRIARRLQVHGLTELPEYLTFLRRNEGEAQSLQRDLLITVTNFFRDKEAFEMLEREVIPKLFADKTSADAVRVWSVGCATGDEAFSLAILLDEYASHITNVPKIQIFASDINEEAIAAARECFYDDAIAADVSPERLRRYFTRENGGWRVRKELRETVLFTPHNVLRDPPFSRLDLVTCRNLLIYFNRETQKKVLGIFNFALRRDGFLFLGASESAETATALFAVADKKQRIYKAQNTPQQQTLPDLPAPGKWNVKVPPPPVKSGDEPLSSFGAIHYTLVEQFAPPSVLVSENHKILHVSEHAARFLRVTPGEPSRDLLETVHPTLKLDLQSALFAAQAESFVGESRNVRFENDGKKTLVNITVRLIHTPETSQGFYLVIFDESKSEAAPEESGQASQTVAGRDAMDNIVQRLENELRINRERLRATIEQNETSGEELKASNEELQAINEELRSASEELETSREELQSLNEELTTINAELSEKIDETVQLNSDLQNLIQSTDIGTIFLDRALRVKRFTPRIPDLFNIIASDIGRPLEHITHKLADDHLSEDAGEVLRSLTMKEREMHGGDDDSRYLLRIAPYRTIDDRIDGVVLNFLDITDIKRASDALIKSEAQLSAIFNQTTAGMVQSDLEGNIILTNERFCEISGYDCDQLLKMRLHELTHKEDLTTGAKLFEQAGTKGTSFTTEKRLIRQDGSNVWVQNTVTPILDRIGKPQSIIVVTLDISKRLETLADLEKSEDKYRTLFNSIDEAFCTIEVLYDNDGKPIDYRFLEVNPMFEKMTGIADPTGKTAFEVVPDLDDLWVKTYAQVVLTGEAVRFESEVAPIDRWLDIYAQRVGDESSRQVAVVFQDITERKHSEEKLRQSEERLRLVLASVADHAIITTDKAGIITGWNTGAEEIFGYAEKETVGQSIEIIFTPEDRAAGIVKKELQTAGEQGHALDERVHLRRDGSRFYVSGAVSPLRSSNGDLLGFVKIARDMTERIKAEKIQHDKEILQRMVGAQEEERKRIARDLHDELGQQMTALRMKIEAAHKKFDKNKELASEIGEMLLFAQTLDTGIDFLAWELRPAVLDDIGLTAALARFIREWSHYSGIMAELLESNLKNARIAPEAETNLYRIVQEALNNIYKHAAAKRVEISLDKRGDLIVLIIEDDGTGFDPEDKLNLSQGIGLIGMRERAVLIGGSFEIESASGKGTTIFVRVPDSFRKKERFNDR